MDSNILSYATNSNDPAVSQFSSRIARLRKTAVKRDGQFHFYVTDTTVKELGAYSGSNHHGFFFPDGTRRVLLDVPPDSNAYRETLRRLNEIGVGRSSRQTGEADRTIVADALFAQTARGEIPTLWTADRGLYMPLCRISPDCEHAAKKGTFDRDMADGFEIEVHLENEIRRLRVLPFLGVGGGARRIQSGG